MDTQHGTTPSNTRPTLSSAAGKYTKPAGGIPATVLVVAHGSATMNVG
jgi:hypothetical protein